jgi:hypothetical protein
MKDTLGHATLTRFCLAFSTNSRTIQLTGKQNKAIRNMSSGVNTLIGRYEHLVKRPHHEKAKQVRVESIAVASRSEVLISSCSRLL